MFACLFVCLFACVFVCLFACLFACLFVCINEWKPGLLFVDVPRCFSFQSVRTGREHAYRNKPPCCDF